MHTLTLVRCVQNTQLKAGSAIYLLTYLLTYSFIHSLFIHSFNDAFNSFLPTAILALDVWLQERAQ